MTFATGHGAGNRGNGLWPSRGLMGWIALHSLLLALTACHRAGPRERTASNADELYSLSVLPKFHLTLSDDALASLKTNPRTFVRGTFRYAGKTYKKVGIRLKGHRSMQGFDRKPAFKLRFDKYKGKQRFLGLRRLTLNNMVEDPTMLREHIAYRIHREAGVVAPRTGYAQVYVNGSLYGLYLNVESLDDSFVASRSTQGGSLYEGEYGCDLYEQDVAGFDRDAGGDAQHSDLRHLAKAVQTGSNELFYGDDSPLDRRRVVAFLAASAFIGDFDGYRHSHNYRLHRDGTTNTWGLVPWGLDRTLKRHMDIYDSGGLLAKRCFADQRCRADYNRELRRIAKLVEGMKLDLFIDRAPRFVLMASKVDTRRPYNAKQMAAARNHLRSFLLERPGVIRSSTSCIDGGKEVDRDGDGYGCMDCDDTNAAVHPGAEEACDGRDNNCSGHIDDGPSCGCPTQNVDGVTFHLCSMPMTWHDAAKFCESQGHTLARVDNPQQAAALFRLATRQRKDKWWIGLSDHANEGVFRWADGKATEYTRWSKGEPDNSACNQDCAAINKRGGGKWHDTHCAMRHPFICRASAPVLSSVRTSPSYR